MLRASLGGDLFEHPVDGGGNGAEPGRPGDDQRRGTDSYCLLSGHISICDIFSLDMNK